MRSVVAPIVGALLAHAALFSCASSDEDVRPAPATPDGSTVPAAEAGVEDASTPEGDIGDADARGRCSDGGFCYASLPLNVRNLVHVSASSMDDVWALSPDAVLRWDGASWSTAYGANNQGTAARFSGLWVSKKDDVWVLATDLDEPDSPVRIVRYSALDGQPPAFRERSIASVPSPYGEPDVHPVFGVTPASDALWLLDHRFPNPPDGVIRFREESDGSVVSDRVSIPVEEGDGSTYRWSSLWTFSATDVYVGGSLCLAGHDPWSGRCATDFFGPAEDIGVIAHYDGTSWSITSLGAGAVLAMYGTKAAGQGRQLWLGVGAAPATPDRPFFGAESVRLVPIGDDGTIGAPLFSQRHRPSTSSTCSFLFGSVISPSAAWLSDGCLVYRWNGTALEPTPTAIDGQPPGRIDGLWAASADDAWIVGRSSQSAGLPRERWRGFAARRTKESAPNEGAP